MVKSPKVPDRTPLEFSKSSVVRLDCLMLRLTSRLLTLVSLLSLAVTGFGVSRPLHAQSVPDTESGLEEPIEQPGEGLMDSSLDELPDDVNDLRPLLQDGALLSMQGGQRLMAEASEAVSRQDYDLAITRLQESRQVFNQLSNFYQQLATSFSGIDNRITDDLRDQALESAQMRDEATYQLALVHRAQDQPELAVPLLIQIVSSQNPTRDLGQRAYQQLFELGFVDSPFPRNQDADSTSSLN